MTRAASNDLLSPSALSRVSEGWRGLVALLVICAVVYVPGLFTLPPVDRDESRFAQASRQMVESGNWAVPMVQDRPRLNKPPLIYWLQSASVKLLGDDWDNAIWVYRLPSALCATGAVLITWRLGRRMFDPRAALLGAALLAACPMVVWDAHQARSDQLLLFTVVLTQYALWRVWKSEGSAGVRSDVLAAVFFWLALSLGVMAKGPIAPMIAACTALGVSIVDRRWRWMLRLQPLLGVLIVAAVVAPWVWKVVQQVGWETYSKIIFDETIGRSREAKEGHWGPPGYHLVLLPALFWPGSFLTAAGVVRAWARGGVGGVMRSTAQRTRVGRRAELFLLAWAIPAWIIFECIGTKLPHYTMPLYPALALLSGRMVLHAASRGRAFVPDAGLKLGIGIWMLITLVIAGLASPAIYIALAYPAGPMRAGWLVVPATLCVILAIRVVWRMFPQVRFARWLHVQLLAFGLALVTPLLLIELNLAREPHLALSSRLAERLGELDPGSVRPIAALEYHEDSLVFLTRGKLRKLDLEAFRAFAAANPDAILILPESVGVPAGFARKETLDGFNYSIGKWVHLVIATREAGGTP